MSFAFIDAAAYAVSTSGIAAVLRRRAQLSPWIWQDLHDESCSNMK